MLHPDRIRRTRKKRLLTVGGVLLLIVGILERAAGWLSGATGGDLAQAMQNVAKFMDGLPVIGGGAIQFALTVAGLLAFAWLWKSERIHSRQVVGRGTVGSLTMGPPQLAIIFDRSRHCRETLTSIGVNTNYVGTVQDVVLAMISISPLARIRELEPACQRLLRDGPRRIWTSGADGKTTIRDNKEARFDLLEASANQNEFIVVFSDAHCPLNRGRYRIRLRATGKAYPVGGEISCEADFEIGISGKKLVVKPLG